MVPMPPMTTAKNISADQSGEKAASGEMRSLVMKISAPTMPRPAAEAT